MSRKVRWGILSTAAIGVNKVIPAMQKGHWCDVVAIASREIDKATSAAQRLGIPKAYGSYEELLADGEIEAIYNPLPNHLHVPWTTRAAEARKHVLCENIRNKPEIGGGSVLDIGCYPISLSRFIFREEPLRVFALIDRDPRLGIDRLTSAILDFPAGQASFTCSIQLVPYQRMQLCGTLGRIEVEIPFNSPSDKPTRILIHDGSDLAGNNPDVKEFPVCDQYLIQGELFSRAILENSAQAIPLEDAVKNMAVIDALFCSASSAQWQSIPQNVN